MTVDLGAAADFLAGAARALDRRRFELLFAGGGTAPVLAALDGYRNPDGGYGWGLEPDLRSATSQPGGALHALETLAETGADGRDRALEVCDWLASVTLRDGGLPFALPIPDPAACAPFWVGADPTRSSLQITAVVAATAYRVAVAVPDVAEHLWLRRASSHCFDAIEELPADVHAMELAFAVRFLDAVATARPRIAEAMVGLVRSHVPADGMLHVAGGAPDEYMRPLDFAPFPGGPARSLFAPEVVEAELDRLAAGQQPDGGWAVDFDSHSSAATLEWRGHRTVEALSLLRANSRL
ncbi:hypothetical protein DQ237_04360 [Blastococcus sp. TF02-8]|uniref:hypothetical protein n=1 Tax=Blastococcus sp. TF02-8 TaxID=2250574 RepID=UPI000DEA3C79|nr:hypothetical protein [Blastococcus sp. TF02-8]RBY97324.1 hypothetical protein DQ237_04360 [Blastococcus sp. TF02-8]